MLSRLSTLVAMLAQRLGLGAIPAEFAETELLALGRMRS